MAFLNCWRNPYRPSAPLPPRSRTPSPNCRRRLGSRLTMLGITPPPPCSHTPPPRCRCGGHHRTSDSARGRWIWPPRPQSLRLTPPPPYASAMYATHADQRAWGQTWRRQIWPPPLPLQAQDPVSHAGETQIRRLSPPPATLLPCCRHHLLRSATTSSGAVSTSSAPPPCLPYHHLQRLLHQSHRQLWQKDADLGATATE
ncbi:hypothetical protein OsI_26972 [Oryza sativa Indica Group]|uniref:Uncharacterized protein n=1 Tax=Oryza sativa subsp. indica TaxID=39946 RepID=B8B4X0_ORYSI|nr:hypothetical protein OsI_26972 [Oryza sativa Indica Group]